MKSIVNRLKEYLDYKSISVSVAEKEINISNASLSKPFKNNTAIKTDTLEKFLITYSDINPVWLITGKGSMLTSNSKGVTLDQINYKELAESRLETINLLKEKIAILEAKETGHDKRKQGNAVEFRDEPRTELIREKVK